MIDSLTCDRCDKLRPMSLLGMTWVRRDGHHDGRLGNYYTCYGANTDKGCAEADNMLQLLLRAAKRTVALYEKCLNQKD